MLRTPVTALMLLSMATGALAGMVVSAEAAEGQGSPPCNNANCYFYGWPTWETECRFLLDAACWYNDDGEIQCRPFCAVE